MSQLQLPPTLIIIVQKLFSEEDFHLLHWIFVSDKQLCFLFYCEQSVEVSDHAYQTIKHNVSLNSRYYEMYLIASQLLNSVSRLYLLMRIKQ